MDGRPTWTDCDEAGDYVVPNVLSPRDLVSRPENMDKTVLHTQNILHPLFWAASYHGVQCRIVLVVNFFIFFKINFSAMTDLMHDAEAIFPLS